MLRGKAVGRQPVGRKVPQVPRHDNIRQSPDSCRQHMAITGIRKFKRRDQGFILRHDRFGKVLVHRCAGPFQHTGVDVSPIGEKVPHPFRMDVGTPKWLIRVPVGETQKKIAKAGGVEDIGVKQRRDPGHPLLQAKFLIAGRQVIEGFTAAEFRLAPVGENILDTHAPVRTYLPTGDSSLVEQLHKVRPRDLQQFGGLSRRQLGVQRHQGDAVAMRHLVQDFLQQPECRTVADLASLPIEQRSERLQGRATQSCDCSVRQCPRCIKLLGKRPSGCQNHLKQPRLDGSSLVPEPLVVRHPSRSWWGGSARRLRRGRAAARLGYDILGLADTGHSLV